MGWRSALLVAVLGAVGSKALYQVASKDIQVDGFVCDGPKTAEVFYPSNGRPGQIFPVVSFLHGYNSGGNDTRINYWYGALLGNISAYGVVVIAPLSSLTVECPRFSEDQLTALRADFKGNNIPADPSRAAVFGQSSGGPPALKSATARGYNIRAAVFLHPAGTSPFAGLRVRVPVLLGTGSKDFVAPAWNVHLLYRAIRSADKSFGVIKGADHNEAAGCDGRLAGRWPHWVGPWLLCHLSGQRDGCARFYRHFCAGDVDKFTQCHAPHHAVDSSSASDEALGRVLGVQA